jgi:mono/diheme cytochrome c family protein
MQRVPGAFLAVLSLVILGRFFTHAASVDLSRLPPAAQREIDFEKDIQAILEKSCLKCHDAEKAKGKLMLDTRAHALQGGDNGPDIIPGDSAKSPLIHFTARLVEDSEMPPAGKGDPLSKDEVALLRAWIDQGAKWPEKLTLRLSGDGAAIAAPSAPLPPPASRPIDFVKDIQPIFAGHCFDCHGPKKQEAQFRLDNKEIALKGGELGPAIVPGNSAESLLVKAIAGVKPDFIMPKKGERLTNDQIGLLRAWIDQGAAWPDSASVKIQDKRNQWAFKAPVRPAALSVPQKNWVRNPIDNFVLARLAKEKLKPSPEAERRTLIRRLSLDLLGLPPTVQEVEAFVADKKPLAYERLVERLLASPHYGERWGRQWLDLARYADTNGYEKDKPRSIWPYRDWVINALNQDMPYDQFIIEQLAGDLLPHPTRSQRVATGFLRNAMQNQEGGIEPEQFRVEALVDRMDTLGKTFLGLTINCCQCHNHKYDPFAQKEYYQLYAFLNNDDESFMEVPTEEQEKQRQDILSKVRGLQEQAINETTNLNVKLAAWQKEFAAAPGLWTVLDPKDWQNFATKYEKQDDSSLLGGGDLQPGGIMRVWVDTELTNITALRLETLTNPNLMYGGPGLLGKGVFVLREFTVEAYAINNPTVTNKINFARAVADMELPAFPIKNAIDGNLDKGGWVPSNTPDHRNENHYAVFECDKPIGFPGGTRMLITLHQKFDLEEEKEHKIETVMLGCFRVSALTNASPTKVDTLSPAQRELLASPMEKRSPEQQLNVFDLFRLQQAGFTNLNHQIDNLWTNWPYPPTTLVLAHRPHPRQTHLFKRGDRLRPGEEVQPAVPAVLHPFPQAAPKNRLGLANWIADRQSPTTARVMVNRIWMAYFGQGLVTTPEDFGTRVDTPSHPELLDWLACEFMDPTTANGSSSPWSLKHIHRLIVNSATYRQSSKVTPELYAPDQYNRLLARGARLRVESEMVQDIALSASGLLNSKIGGPSVYPPIPASVGDTVYGGFTWPESKGDDRYRRGLYTFAKRSLPFPSLTAFDAPSGETSCPRRLRSNTPLQALTTLNEKTFVEAAQAMALRVFKDGGSNNRARLNYAFELCTGRKPTSSESSKLLSLWKEQRAYFENRTATALNVAVPDLKKMPQDVNLHTIAAWAMVSRVLLNLDETITRE